MGFQNLKNLVNIVLIFIKNVTSYSRTLNFVGMHEHKRERLLLKPKLSCRVLNNFFFSMYKVYFFFDTTVYDYFFYTLMYINIIFVTVHKFIVCTNFFSTQQSWIIKNIVVAKITIM